MNKEEIITKGVLYDKCENMEQLYDKYYYPLLVEHKQLQNNWNELKEYLKKIIEECGVPIRQYYAEHVLGIMQEIESRK